MNVARREKFSPACRDPAFPRRSLTLRAVAVAAGVVRDGSMPAAGARIEMTAEWTPPERNWAKECRESGGPWRRKNRPPEMNLRKRSEEERFVGYRRDVHRGAICTS